MCKFDLYFFVYCVYLHFSTNLITALAPTFTRSLTDQSISIGEQLILICSVNGIPQPHVEFYRENTRLLSSDRISVEHDSTNTHWRMVIKESVEEDYGRYRAVARNTVGTAISESSVTKKTEAPTFERGLKYTKINERDEIRLEVKVSSGTQPITVLWYKDNQSIKQDTAHEILSDIHTNTYSLIIKESKITDTGRYTVKAENIAGSSESTADVEVIQITEKPTFVKKLTSSEININESIVLDVTVKGQPSPEVSWKKNGQQLSIDGSHIISRSEKDGNFSITISSVGVDDAGEYSCVATNEVGTEECRATLTVKKILEAPQFIEKLEPVIIKETETTSLSTTVTGKPQPEIKWFKDDNEINIDNVHVFAREEGVGHFILTIKDIKMADQGVYSCKAFNEVGEACTEASVHVSKHSIAPQFTETLRAIQVKETEAVNLSVTVTGSPTPKLTWFKDDVPIDIDNVHVLTKDEGSGHFVLTIKDAKVTDVGSYSCKAVNEAGEAYTEATVNVSKESVAPQFTETLRAVQVKETEAVNLSVTVTGSPTPKLTWFKDDVPIDIDNVHVLTKDEGSGHFVLTIKDAKVTDVGSYSCKAVNDAGEARTEATVNVAKESIAPQFTEILKPLEVTEGQSFQAHVTVTGSPAPNVVWLKDNVPVELDSTHVICKDHGDGQFTLVINNAQVSDIGSYSCRASNEAGIAETEAKFSVIEELLSPHFEEKLTPLEVDMGKPAMLSCTVIGKPEPEVTWFKDGVAIQIDHDHFSRKDSIGEHALIIKNLRVEDVGSYSCEAVNKAGKDITIADVKFPKYGFEKTKTEDVEPLFIEPLEESYANDGEMVVLECRVNEESHPEILWYKNNVPIEIDQQHMITEMLDDGRVKLTIYNVTGEDIGSYRCEAVNKAGKAETQAKLNYARYMKETVSDESEHLSEIAIEPVAKAGGFLLFLSSIVFFLIARLACWLFFLLFWYFCCDHVFKFPPRYEINGL
ncbi:immunoglobulin I-set domain protein [Dictyocaulus viviparus]|uniref:Immunoglobulin I-set domain protein n=1 Tax=Dictyocaulus viviparus TaxID=29172 RepID=A0A0D8XKM1_DICVI|nr:immunoglobulin I-set domain protein [Dictyocaulus viviparus]